MNLFHFQFFFIKSNLACCSFSSSFGLVLHQLVKNSDTEIQMMLVIQCDNDRLDQDPLNL